MNEPFLKWPGGKRQLAARLASMLPLGRRLIEPFVGSGAVALATDYPSYLLTDSNPDLINLYRYLADGGTEFIDACSTYFTPHYNTPAVYYEMRSIFNAETDPYCRAVLMVYLNRHCFNGLWRVNSRGEFNAPVGSYKQPKLPREKMEAFYTFLIEKKPVLRCQDFEATFAEARPGDVIYADPPYVPISKTANFTSYGAGGFGPDEQKHLADLAEDARKAGISVVISNSDSQESRQLYQSAKVYTIGGVKRSIAARGERRRSVDELVVVYAGT